MISVCQNEYKYSEIQKPFKTLFHFDYMKNKLLEVLRRFKRFFKKLTFWIFARYQYNINFHIFTH